MTAAVHKRRSGDFKMLEQKARSFEVQIQQLKGSLEKERQDYQKALVEFRMRMQDRCLKLEHEVHAGKIESTMYTEMIHEIVTENDDLRKQIKVAQRQMPRNDPFPLTMTIVVNSDNGGTSGSSSGEDDDNHHEEYEGDSEADQGHNDNDENDGNDGNDENDDNDDSDGNDGNDGNDEDDDDLVYVTHVLRSQGVNWRECPQYASHRLIVLQYHDDAAAATSTPSPSPPPPPQYHLIMEQFVMPSSAVFRDVIRNHQHYHEGGDDGGDEEEEDSDDEEEEDSDDEDTAAAVYQKRQLSCLRVFTASEATAAAISFPSVPPRSSRPLPEGVIPHSLLVHFSALKNNSNTDDGTNNNNNDDDNDLSETLAQLPLLQLYLPYPDHFSGLLKVMYDHDFAHWENECFRPETIGPITEIVSLLVCSFELTACCLKYYRRIKDDLAEEQLQHESMEALKTLYKRACETPLLYTRLGWS
ncbi:hypothetical protein BGZ65_009902 [Modicella reniformis]|uniref:Uncharacterized protein n=1 Tax=Modicella reniformis TaxID=1440133 RepID=A0A9P6LSW5_9FUNG|nr:hypothetical protein BGZ65_009902 [Modicella reniformis]